MLTTNANHKQTQSVPANSARGSHRQRLPKNVLALGVVSALNDMASEVAIRTIPLFLANVLGVKTGIIGLIEGIAESTATVCKLLAGLASDRMGRRKPLTLLGFTLSNVMKPLLFFAYSWPAILTLRFLDRVGNRRLLAAGWLVFSVQLLGFAYATTVVHLAALLVLYGLYLGLTEGVEKALLTDLAPEESRGTAFGYFHVAVGAAALPASAITGVVWQWYGSRAAFLTGAVLAALGAILLAFVPTSQRQNPRKPQAR
jgi:MFS family permease